MTKAIQKLDADGVLNRQKYLEDDFATIQNRFKKYQKDQKKRSNNGYTSLTATQVPKQKTRNTAIMKT